MKTDTLKPLKDETLAAAKREQQQRSQQLVRTGARPPESMFLIAPTIAKALVIRHRTIEF